MKRNTFILSLILLTQVFSSCKDQSTTPASLDDLHLRFVSGYIGADLMPSFPPFRDPIGCQIIIVAENTSATRTLSKLSAPQADVFLNSSNQKLGTITFTTTWDGQLDPTERDTVRLTKVISQTTLLTPQCGMYVYLNLTVQNDSKTSISLKTDSLAFGCAY